MSGERIEKKTKWSKQNKIGKSGRVEGLPKPNITALASKCVFSVYACVFVCWLT